MQPLRASIVATLILLTIQGWTGDFANLFAAFPAGGVGFTIGGFLRAVAGSGPLVDYHVLEAFLILAFSLATLAISVRQRIGRLFAILGAASVTSAGIGGVLFVLSGFTNNANSAQMGGSFIGAYAFYFLALYSTKK
jgi:hypothetical protein